MGVSNSKAGSRVWVLASIILVVGAEAVGFVDIGKDAVES